ncbi:MAG: DeoR family transcriptional regulator [Coprobacillus cateniformis]
MNIRQKHMLNTLVNDGSIHIGTSAQKFNVGERTIRYDLDVIAGLYFNKVTTPGINDQK